MLERTGLPIGQLPPSHVNQTDASMADATLWAARGGFVDVVEERLSATEALRVVTSNVAAATGLTRNGRIAPGLDADLIAFDADWQIRTPIARGRVMVEHGRPVARGAFDQILLDQLG